MSTEADLQYVRRVLNDRDYNLREIATTAGTTYSTVNALRKGVRQPSIDILIRVRKACEEHEKLAQRRAAKAAKSGKALATT